jgi:hypothetical protein
MNKSELKMLEKVFEAEVAAVFSAHGIHLFQTKSKLAEKLTKEGFLNFCQINFSGLRISGYELTHAGRLAYCLSESSGTDSKSPADV